jgi:hypothetical protein
MTTAIKNFCQLWGGSCEASYSTRHVPLEYSAALKAAGVGRPITSFEDPRLECPELLLLHGYTYTEGAFRAGRGDCLQTFTVLEDGTQCVETRAGSRVHEAVRHPDGRVESRELCGTAGLLL